MLENIISVLSIFLIAFVSYIIFQRGTKKTNFLYAAYFTFFFLLGTVLHLIGILYNGTEKLPLAIVHSIISSFRMFTVNVDTSSITKLAQDNIAYLIFISLCYFGAMAGSVLAVVNTFFNGIINAIKLFFLRFSKKIILIYGGMETDILLKGLSKRERKSTVVVVPNESMDEKSSHELKKCLINKGIKYICGLPLSKALKKACGFKTKKETIVISMSNKEQINLSVAKLYTDYFTNKLDIKLLKDGKLTHERLEILNKIKLSVNIMYRNLERAEHFDFVENAFGRIKFFNIHELRARKFLDEYPITKLIPSGFINTTKARLNKKVQPAVNDTLSDEFLSTANSYKISNIFIGFGSTNSHLLNKSICNGQILGCDYRALILDKNIKESELQFFNNSSGIYKGRLALEDKMIYFPHPNENYNIDFEESNVLSVKFYDRIIKEVRSNDFSVVYISIGDDRLAMETALELRQKLCEYKDKENGSVLYNRNRVKMFVKIKENSILNSDKIINASNAKLEPIVCYGADNEVLTLDYIANEKLDKKAIAIANSYANIAQMNDEEKKEFSICNHWNLLSNFKRESNRYSAMSIEVKLNLLGLTLNKEGKVVDLTSGEQITKQQYFQRYDKSVFSPSNPDYSASAQKHFYETIKKDSANLIIDTARNNLARLEHQRWNAFHLTNGWTKLPLNDVSDTLTDKRTKGRQNEIARQHACITTFEGLAKLRDIQAKKNLALNPSLDFEQMRQNVDTISYDYHIMDELFDILKLS